MTAGEVAARVEAIFAAAGAYREGHFGLKSGRHGDRYIEKFQVLQWPAHVAELCSLLIDGVAGASSGAPASGRRFDVVVGPTTGGVILAYECARQLGARGIFAEQVAGPDGRPTRALRRGFRVEPGERVLLVDDVVSTGASLQEMLPVVEADAGELAIAVVVDRSGGLRERVSVQTGRRYPVVALWTLDLPTWAAGDDCPGCGAGLPLEKPGSSGVG